MFLGLKRELPIFLVVGACTVLIDYLIYQSCIYGQVVNTEIAKSIGFIAGTTFAYVANKFWTFKRYSHTHASIYRFIALYTSTLITNVTLNSLILHVATGFEYANIFAFFIATSISAGLNFTGMKYFVFTNNNKS